MSEKILRQNNYLSFFCIIFSFDEDEENIPTLLLSKYEELKDLYEKMTVKNFKNRPDCSQLLEDKNSWSLEKTEFNFSEILNDFPKPYSFVYYMIETKLQTILKDE
jgi:hypothetical protein